MTPRERDSGVLGDLATTDAPLQHLRRGALLVAATMGAAALGLLIGLSLVAGVGLVAVALQTLVGDDSVTFGVGVVLGVALGVVLSLLAPALCVISAAIALEILTDDLEHLSGAERVAFAWRWLVLLALCPMVPGLALLGAHLDLGGPAPALAFAGASLGGLLLAGVAASVDLSALAAREAGPSPAPAACLAAPDDQGRHAAARQHPESGLASEESAR